MIVVDSIATEGYKTKKIAEMLKALGSEKKALIVLSEVDAQVIASAANIPGVKTAQVNTLNVYDIPNADKFIVVKLRRCTHNESAGHRHSPHHHGEIHDRRCE